MATNETPWMTTAVEWIGVAELPGGQHNPKILELWKYAGVPLSTDEDAWCAAFANWILGKAGYRTPSDRYEKVRARAYGEPVAKRVETPQFGDIVLIRNSAGTITHVTFFVELLANGYRKCLGGNQSNQVKYSNYSKASIEGYYRPVKSAAVPLPQPRPAPRPVPPVVEDPEDATRGDDGLSAPVTKTDVVAGGGFLAAIGAAIASGAKWAIIAALVVGAAYVVIRIITTDRSPK